MAQANKKAQHAHTHTHTETQTDRQTASQAGRQAARQQYTVNSWLLQKLAPQFSNAGKEVPEDQLAG